MTATILNLSTTGTTTSATLRSLDSGDVRVTLAIGSDSVHVRAEWIGNDFYWRCPDAATVRTLVDLVLAETGHKRTERRMDDPRYSNAWAWIYPIQ